MAEILLEYPSVIFAVAMTGCEKQGPLEEAGKKAFDAIRDVPKAIEDATY